MLVQKSEQIYTDLSSFTALTNLLTNGVNSIRPLVAETLDGNAFITYNIRFNGLLAKGSTTDFQVAIQSWSENYNTSLAIADQVENALGESNNYYTYLSAEPKFSEQGQIYTEQIFNIKK